MNMYQMLFLLGIVLPPVIAILLYIFTDWVKDLLITLLVMYFLEYALTGICVVYVMLAALP